MQISEKIFKAVEYLKKKDLWAKITLTVVFLSYLSFAWPDLRIRGSLGLMGTYVAIVALFVLLFPLLSAVAYDFISFGVVPIATCFMLGAFLGYHSRQSRLRLDQNM